MKKLVFCLFLLTAVFSCRKPQDTPPLQNILTQGSWRISLLRDNGNNITYLYNGWQFTFNADKTMQVSDGTTTYNGTWNENSQGDTFELDISSTELELEYISKLWHNELINPNGVLFQNDRNNPTQELQFTKL
ncbi:hypothetical protein [Lacibacter sp.]|uniref:hypothetical protein n=1 Tax=Lacibacter sp. TaxID=1915409 RepID=UPI002B4B7EE3|nr:hypothetical protein [Lacibacter sp.]HLP39241.1 hypothetical protein [Lacibacter sp.]